MDLFLTPIITSLLYTPRTSLYSALHHFYTQSLLLRSESDLTRKSPSLCRLAKHYLQACQITATLDPTVRINTDLTMNSYHVAVHPSTKLPTSVRNVTRVMKRPTRLKNSKGNAW